MKSLIILILLLCPVSATAASHTWAVPCQYPISLTFTWDANVEQDLAGYKLYWKLSEMDDNEFKHINVGNITNGTISEFCPCQIYEVVVTAYDVYGNESDFSNKVIVKVGSPDIDGDGDVDGSDLARFCEFFGKE